MKSALNTTKKVIASECISSKDNKERYLIMRSWDEKLPSALVIMLYPTAKCDVVLTDLSTNLTINALVEQGFGSVKITNLFCKIGEKCNKSVNKINDEIIYENAKTADKIILAFGRNVSNKVFIDRKQNIIDLLDEYKNKLYMIADDKGKVGFHPLSPLVRKKWTLVKI